MALFKQLQEPLKQYVFSPGLLTKFLKHLQVATCGKCQAYSPMKTQAPTMTPIKVKAPWELVGMDLIGKVFFFLYGVGRFKHVIACFRLFVVVGHYTMLDA